MFVYAIDGSGNFGTDEYSGHDVILENRQLALYADGESVSVKAVEQSVRFLLISGKPLGEPVAWGGPIVMNTQEELRTAFDEYNRGTFIKFKPV